METIALEQDAVGIVYQNVRGLIYQTALTFFERYGGELEEWIAEANFIFLAAYDTYDESKGLFTTWCRFCIWTSLGTYKRRLSKQQPRAIQDENNDVAARNIPARIKSNFKKGDFLSTVGEDAVFLLNLIWSPPSTLSDVKQKKGSSPCHFRTVLKKYLKELNWTGRRIQESFEEVKEALYA